MTLTQVLDHTIRAPGKLECNFPWTLREASAKYFKSLWNFAVGSFAVPLVFLGSVLALCQYPLVMRLFMDHETTYQVVGMAFLVGALLSTTAYYLAWRRRRKSFSFDNAAYLLSSAVIGGLLFCMTFLVALHLLFPVFPRLIKGIADMLSDASGNPNMSFVMVLSTVSFVLGFGMQMRSIDRSLKEAGTTLRDFMALNLNKRLGNRWWKTAWNVFWPAALAFVLWQPIEWGIVQVLGACDQPTMKMARDSTGGNFLLFALMAAVGAPIFEEIVFRGFLFQVVRGTLRMPLPPVELAAIPTEGNRLKLRRAWVAIDNWVRQVSDGVSRSIHDFLARRPDLTAVLLSSFMFAVLHMQFQPTALVLLFTLGCIHAEVYRRTGSLYCSMLLHALNNGTVVVLLAMGLA